MTKTLYLEQTQFPSGARVVCTALVPIGVAEPLERDDAGRQLYRVRAHGLDAGTWVEVEPGKLEKADDGIL